MVSEVAADWQEPVGIGGWLGLRTPYTLPLDCCICRGMLAGM